jgi:hypothetical protein
MATGLGRTPSVVRITPFHEVLNFTHGLGPTRSEKRSTGTRHRCGIVFVRPSPWRSRARGGGDGAAACLGMNRTIFPSRMKTSSHTRRSVVICSLRFYRNLQPGLDSFDPFNFFNFTISRSAGLPPENSASCSSAGLVCALPYCESEEGMLKISFIHRLFLELMNEEYQMRLLSSSFAGLSNVFSTCRGHCHDSRSSLFRRS